MLLPELFSSGFRMTPEIWRAAEPFEGPTTRWLRATAKRRAIWLGISFLEAASDQLYNSFVLASPQGEIAGRVRKSRPAGPEAYFYRAGADPHVIETPLGRIAGPEDVAESLMAIVTGLPFTTGAVIPVDGGICIKAS